MEQKTITAETQAHYKHLSFYLHEQRKWERAVVRRTLITLPLIALTLGALYKHKPLMSMGGVCASTVATLSLKKANFYRRRATYRVRQQKNSMEMN